MNRALFLDRDGVINEDYGYVHKIEDFHFREGIFDVCRAAQKARMKIIIVTNQAGIGRGLFSKDQYLRLTSHIISSFMSQAVVIHGIYFCPYHPLHGQGHYLRDSFDRKPRPGMILKACAAHNINPASSIMIGDRDSDRAACYAANIRVFQSSLDANWAHKAIELINQ